MKKTTFFLTILILCLASSCSKKVEFILKGEITNLPTDTLLVYYQVPKIQFDTLFCKDGKFTYTITPDTFTMFSLILDEQEVIPIFANKGETVNINGEKGNLNIEGDGENKLMAQIFNVLKGLSPTETEQKVDSLILANPHSFTNIYLIDKYYTRNPSANFDNLEKLIKNLHGIIKDTPSMTQLQSSIESLDNPHKNRSILSLQAYNKDGKEIKWNEVQDKYILLNFWASWHPQSITERDSLKSILKQFEKEDFIIFNVSLDMDKDAWVKAIDEETDQWRHICDFKGWNNYAIRNQNIYQLPCNLLLSPSKRIAHRNLSQQELIDKLKELLKEKKEQEKRKKRK